METGKVSFPLFLCSPYSDNGSSRPVFTYLKSRGFYAGVQVDGTVIIERTDENERFYGERIGVADILAGKARHPPYEVKMLMETLKSAEGSNDVDEIMMQRLEDEPAPADMELTSPSADAHVFGIPEPDDPDPFGVLALEKEGFEIREAGSGTRPPSTQFEFNPSPTSPVYGKFHRRSMDTIGTRSNRESYMSNRSFITRASIDRGTQTESGTQTEEHITPITSPSISSSDQSKPIIEEEDEKEHLNHPLHKPTDTNNEPESEVDYTKIDLGPYSGLTIPTTTASESQPQSPTPDLDGTTIHSSPRARAHSTADTSFTSTTTDDEDEGEEPIIFEAAAALTPQAGLAIKARGGLVNIPKRPGPPPLPPRSGARGSRVLMVDQASGQSPIRGDFEEVELHGGRHSVDSRRSVASAVTEVEKRGSVVVGGEVVRDDMSSEEKHEPSLEIEKEEKPVVLMENGNVEENEKPVVLAEHGATETNDLLHVKTESEDDRFHSVPSSPMEVVDVK